MIDKEKLKEISQFFDGLDSKVKSAKKSLDKTISILSFTGEPTKEQIDGACFSFYHGFGLMSKEEQDKLRFQAKEWFHAWRKEFE